MAADNSGVCEKCRELVPADHSIRDNQVYLVKTCTTCGRTEALVSTNAVAWNKKRDIWHYDPETVGSCGLNCLSCGHEHHPAMVFLNVTNRCNMNCPICIANIPGMGFEFHPRIEYFEHVLDGLAKMKPRPVVNLFGGEPTLREDLFEIIRMAKERKIKTGIVTNGLRLADEEFCRQVCESGARVLLAFDGRSPEIYQRLRKSSSAYEKKLKALENLKKFTKKGGRRHTLMCCVARKINDKYMRDLIDYCHENRAYIQFLHLIPLTETWKEGEFETDVTTTIEDAEQIVMEAFPDEKVEFLPAGLGYHLEKVLSFFGSPRLRFGGVHPNCESAAIFYSDGTRYRPLSSCLKRPLAEIGKDAVSRARSIHGKLDKLDPKKWSQRWRGRFIVLKAYAGMMRGSIRLSSITRGSPFFSALKIIGGMLIGKKLKTQLEKHTLLSDKNMLYMIVLPFEEYHSIEGHRLRTCAAGFAFEDPDTGLVRTIPVCTWGLYRDNIERKLAAKYGVRSPERVKV